MKKLFLAVAVLIFSLNVLATPAMAVDIGSGYTIHYEDGSYAVITLGRQTTRASINDTKAYVYYNSQGQRCFAYTLYAAFTYNGVTSRADSCDYAVVIYRQGWDMDSHSEYVSGNTAYGRAVFTGPDGQTRTASLTLSCDRNGNVV